MRIDPSGRPIDERLLGEDIHGLARHDYDGDGERDLILSLSDGYRVQFGDADDEYTEPEPVPSIVEEDQGIGQSFDLDRDGRTERILLFVDEDKQRGRWQALGWGPCPVMSRPDSLTPPAAPRPRAAARAAAAGTSSRFRK